MLLIWNNKFSTRLLIPPWRLKPFVMWPNTFNKKCATISGWQCLGDFAAVKQQLQKIRASTRIPPRKGDECRGAQRPLPPLPPNNKGRHQLKNSSRFTDIAVIRNGGGVISPFRHFWIALYVFSFTFFWQKFLFEHVSNMSGGGGQTTYGNFRNW